VRRNAIIVEDTLREKGVDAAMNETVRGLQQRVRDEVSHALSTTPSGALAAGAAEDARELRGELAALREEVARSLSQSQSLELQHTVRELQHRVGEMRDGPVAKNEEVSSLWDELAIIREELARMWTRALAPQRAVSGSPSPSLDATPGEGLEDRMEVLADQVRRLEALMDGGMRETSGSGGLLNARVGEAEGKLEGLSGQCSRIAGAVSSVSETVGTVIAQSKDDIGRLREEVGALTEAVAELGDRVVEAEVSREAVDALRGEISHVKIAVEEQAQMAAAHNSMHSPWPSPPPSASKPPRHSPALLAAQKEVARELETEMKSLRHRWRNKNAVMHDLVWLFACVFFLRHPLFIQLLDVVVARGPIGHILFYRHELVPT